MAVGTGDAEQCCPDGLEDEAGGGGFVAGVEFADGAEEEAVAAHGVIDACAGETHAVCAAEGGDEDGTGHEEGPACGEDLLESGGADAIFCRELDAACEDGLAVGIARERQDHHVCGGGKQVHEDDEAGAHGQGEGDVSSGVLHFSGCEGDVVPGVGGEEGADLDDAEEDGQVDENDGATDADLNGMEGRPAGVAPEVTKIGGDGSGVAADGEGENDESGEGEAFGGGEDVLDEGADVHAEDVDDGEEEDEEDTDEIGGGDAYLHIAEDHGADADGGDMGDVPEPVGAGDGGEEDAEEFAEGDTDGGDGAGLDDEEEGPSVEKAPHGAEGFAEVDVLAAGRGHHGGEFAIGERADDGHEAGDDPGGEEEGRGVSGAGDIGIDKEDAGADHGADDDGSGAEKPERGYQLWAGKRGG